MAVCEQKHFHLQDILAKLSTSPKRLEFLKNILTKFFKDQKETKLHRCSGCAYVIGYKDGLNNTKSTEECIPYRGDEEAYTKAKDAYKDAYRRGFGDGIKERLSK